MSSNPYEDERELVLGCARGDPGRWDEFIRQYGRLIKSTAAAVHRRCDAWRCELDDMGAHVYEKLLEDHCRRIRAWQGRSRFSTYLVQVAKNLCIDYVKGHNRSDPVDELDRVGTWLDRPAAAEQEKLDEARRRALRAAIDQLPSRQAMVIRMRLEGLPLRRIAQILNVPEGTVFADNSRALESLRRALDDAMQQEDRE